VLIEVIYINIVIEFENFCNFQPHRSNFCRQYPKYGTYSFQIKANMKHKELSNHERKCQYFSKIKTVQNTLYIYSYFIAFSSNFFSGLW